ncbi:hypothetical protein HYH03_007642 [Edaphochlamys debaryana]|uniref:Uncharacterized protein n=1 Tax=Edaphochlamys debaryana TaxID=47281 RepID=A0A836C0B4_9CHLO|nr:hypothetical protein HYH03_007642 [Edaphochlamys debaryana]|eukprot:KAG2494289.1 hypothetical protein HYH03_007642 [Edaphochlamys debaryana]
MSHLAEALASVARAQKAVSVGLGPHGLDQLISDEANQSSITSSGEVILGAYTPQHPLGALILQLVRSSCASMGDASKRVLLMVMAGLRQFLRSGLHPTQFQADLADQVLQCVVPSAVLHVPLVPGCEQEAAEAVQALAASHLCGGVGGGTAAAAHLAACVQALVLAQLEAAARAGISAAQALAGLRDDPPIARLPGPTPSASRLLAGVLLAEAPLGEAAAAAVAAGRLSRQGRAAGCTSFFPEHQHPTLARPLLHSPVPFLALACPLDGGATAGAASGAPAAVLATSGSERAAAAEALAEALRRRVEAAARRGARLLLLAGRPPEGAAQMCQRYGMVLVAGLDDADVARAAAAGGTTALTSAEPATLAAAPLGSAKAARLVQLGARRATLLEFDQSTARGQAAVTLLLAAPTDAALRRCGRAVRRCLVSLAAALGTMARDPEGQGSGGGGGGTRSGTGSGGGGGGCAEAECWVLVAGGGCFEALLELQLRELVAVAQRGPEREEDEEDEARQQEEEQEDGAAVCAAAAAEAGAVSQLVASLKVLHAMAAAVPLALAGGGGGDGGACGLPGCSLEAARRAQREALAQVTALRAAQAAALRSGGVCRWGLVVPSAAFSPRGRALGALCQDEPGNLDPSLTSKPRPPEPRGHESHVTAPWQTLGGTVDGSGGRTSGGAARGGGGGRGAAGGGGPGPHGFRPADAVAHGVVESAAVAAGAWSRAVEILVQVIRIDGSALPASRHRAARGGAGLQMVGPEPVAAPRPRRGGRHSDPDSGAEEDASSREEDED